MMKVLPLAILLVGIVVGFGLWTWSAPNATNALSFKSTDVAAGEKTYVDNCASCHGANLEGQDDWRSPGPDGKLPAPPHDETGHTWHHSDQVLFDYTKLGGTTLMAQQGIEFDSGMPGFGDQLTDSEIRDVLAFIKSTWPDEIQKLQSER